MLDFSGLGAALKAMYDKVTGKPAPNHAAIAAAIDNIHRATVATDEVYRSMTSLYFTTIIGRLPNGPLKQLLGDFAKTQKVDPGVTLMVLANAISLIRADVDKLDRNFARVFGDLKTMDDLKVTHAYVFGYLTLAEKTAEYFARLVYLVPHRSDERPPAYILKALIDDTPAVAAFVKTLLEVRGQGRRTIMDDLTSITAGAKNFFLVADGKTLDDFASAKDYLPQVSQVLAQGISLNPAMWVVGALLALQRYKYERNVKMREWMVTRVALMELETAGMGDTAEYQKKRAILDAYTTMIAALDKKIAEYENYA